MIRSIRTICVLLAALAVTVLAGCGSDNGSNGVTVAPPTIAVDADIASGCWTASMRASSTGGNVSSQQWKQAPDMVIDPAKTYAANIVTNKGDFTITFFPGDAPIAVNNFVCLARAGYYDNTPFHRIVDGFVIQGGDPTGTGAGGPGYQFADEKITRDYTKGTIAMANAGPNTNGSQFFVCTADLRGKLGKNYTIFGEVTSGMDVIDAIAKTPTKVSRSGEKSTPTEPVTLVSATITES